MSDRIERPVFFEGQVLGASDLESSVEYGRGHMARHERYLHTWGIAYGLELSGEDRERNSTKYKDITVSAGVASDGTGRQIVVPESERLDPELFLDLNIAREGAWHPVFLVGRDEDPAAEPLIETTCGTTQPRRKVEGYEITFGRPGDELELDEQTSPAASGGPDGGWKVLLGFVKWNSTIERFSDLADSSGGIGRRYAGALADEVVARGGVLSLRSAAATENGKPIVVVDEADGGKLQFGLQTNGVVQPVFTVKASGDVAATGTITGKLTTGVVYVESGVAYDGMLVPLPAGITEDDVEAGQVVLHVSVTPRYPGSPKPSGAGNWIPIVAECLAVGRRVRCRYLWTKDLTVAPTYVNGACDYLVVAYVPASSGSTS